MSFHAPVFVLTNYVFLPSVQIPLPVNGSSAFLDTHAAKIKAAIQGHD
jgi:hypothetical protein